MFTTTSTLVALALLSSPAAAPAVLEDAPRSVEGPRSMIGPPAMTVTWSASPRTSFASLPAAEQQERQPLDVNKATAEELQTIPGIGEALARRIIEFRQEHGPLEKVDDLLNVRGIGEASLEKLRPFLAVKKQG